MKRVLALAALGLVLLGVGETALLIWVAKLIGPALTILLLFTTTAVGLSALRKLGPRGWKRFQSTLAQGRPPGRVALDGLLAMLAALLLIVPGLITDVIGLLLLLPPVRTVSARIGLRLAERAATRRLAPAFIADLFGPRLIKAKWGAPRVGPTGQ